MMKRALFFAVMLAIPIACAELLAYQLTKSFGSLFGPDEGTIERLLDEKAYQTFLAEFYHPELGWQNPRDRALSDVNCIGEEKKYSWNKKGARHLNTAEEDVQIIAVGDSYTHGYEASDEETYPHHLENLLGLPVANYGVNGFGSLQATEQFERAFEFHPNTRIALLGVMSENIRRIPNTYRGIFLPDQNPFHFKPYVDISGPEAQKRQNPNMPAAKSVAELRPTVVNSLKTDYWSLPQPTFPYSWSVIQALRTNVFNLLVQRKLASDDARVDYDNTQLVSGLRYAVERFIKSATERGVHPVIIFIPENKRHLTGPAELIEDLRTEQPDALFIDVGDAKMMNWDRYNLKETFCHPSAYGYRQIAQHVAEALAHKVGTGNLNGLN